MPQPALRTATLSAAAVSLAAFAAPAFAQDAAPGEDADGGVSFAVGLGVGGGTSHLKKSGAGVGPFPILSVEGEHFALTPEAATVRTSEWNGFTARAFATYRQSDIEASESAFFAGIDRDPAVELGGGVSYESDFGTFDVALQGDVADAHSGTELTLGYSYDVMLGKTIVTPKLSLSRMSEKLAEYSYGVSATEARADRPGYDIGAVWSAGIGVDVARPITENWMVFGGVEGSFVDDETFDSPLVNKRAAVGAAVGLLYKF